MKRFLLFLLLIVSYLYGHAAITVDVGKTETIYCKATAPAGYIDHVFFFYTNPDDANYVALEYNSADCKATIYGLQAKSDIKIEVYYTYTYTGTYDNRRHVGSGSYYEYITVNHSLVVGTPYKERNEEGYDMWFVLNHINDQWYVATVPTIQSLSCFDSDNKKVEGKITIPSMVQGFPVKTIGGNSFFCCYDITEIIIPSSITEIGVDAFYKCYGLKNVVCLCKTPPTDYTPKNGKRKSAFYGCTSSATLYVPKGCKTKYQNADGWKEFSNIKEIGSDGVVVNSVTLNYDKLNLNVGDTKQLTSTVSPSNATDGSCNWTSSNTNVATVTSNGYVLATGEGTATITCTANDEGGAKALCTVVVNKVSLESIYMPSESETLSVNETRTLTYGVLPANATNRTVTWTSDNKDVVTVDNSGTVTAKTIGTATITCKANDGGSSASCRINVIDVKVKRVAAGDSHSLIVKEDGSLWACGYNGYGQLGDGTTTDRTKLVKIMTGVSSVSAGNYHSLILKEDGSLWASGYNGDGQLGDGTTKKRYTPVKIMTGVSSVSAGKYHSLILKEDGSLWACGYNKCGQLGDGTTTDRTKLVKIMTGVSSVSAGNYHSLILKKDGSLWACGSNNDGQLGDGTTTDRTIPVKIMTGVSSVSAGNYHSLILKEDGSLWACGSNTSGQLGDGTTTGKSTPIKIMDGVSSVSSGSSHTLIIKTDGSMWACGDNEYGQLGDGSTSDKSTPVKIMEKVSYVSAGGSYSLIVKNDGSMWACGNNRVGQLGDGSNIYISTPVMVIDGNASYTLELSNAGYATFYDSENSYILPKQLSASVVASYSNNKLEYKTIAEGKSSNNVIPKGTAVMLTSDNNVGGLFTLGKTSDKSTYTSTNYLHGSDEATMTSTAGSNYYYKLTYGNGNNSNVFGWYWGNSNGAAFNIEGHRAWLALPKSTTSTRSFSIDGDATGIEEIVQNEENNAIYDLLGRRIGRPNANVIYIKKGKKLLLNKTK